MWLYVPSTSSASAPAEPGSTSEWNWQSQALARSCWWRGKRGPSQLWLRRCKQVSWLQRLCGAMPEPSTAALGVASWTDSLAASRASPIASPEKGSLRKTTEISGARPDASSSSREPGGFSSKTSAAWSHRADCDEFGQTFDDLVSRLSSDCLRRKRSVRRINASASSSSRWPTARAAQGGPDRVRRDTGRPNSTLETAVAMWGTPTARDWKDGGADLTNVPENGLLGRMAANWSTPRATDGEKGGPHQNFGAGGTPLPAQAQQWPTPRAKEDGEYQYSRGDKTKPVPTLSGAAQNWSTPSVADTTGSRKTRSGDRSDEQLLNGQTETVSSLLDRPISTVGEESSHIRRSLNPLFVEWLMGWLRGWTSLALMPPASNGCACSVTELSLWKQRMRSELLRIGLPGDQPVQQRLFV